MTVSVASDIFKTIRSFPPWFSNDQDQVEKIILYMMFNQSFQNFQGELLPAVNVKFHIWLRNFSMIIILILGGTNNNMRHTVDTLMNFTLIPEWFKEIYYPYLRVALYNSQDKCI